MGRRAMPVGSYTPPIHLPNYIKCAGCLGRITPPRQRLLDSSTERTLTCPHCDRSWRFTFERGHFVVQEEVLHDTIKPGDGAKDKAQAVGEKLVEVIRKQRESAKLTKELWRRYLRDCAALEIDPVVLEEPDEIPGSIS